MLVLDTAAVGRLNWQPRWTAPPLECVASRRGDVVELTLGLLRCEHSLADGVQVRYQLDAADNDAGTVTARRIN